VSQFFTYICTRSTADPFIPRMTASVEMLSRDVSDAFSAISGGHREVGQLAFSPVQRSVPDHLLCDGQEVSQASFPELYSFLGDSEGAATAGKFKLPDYLAAFSPAATADAETVTDGTVSAPPPAVPPPTDYPEREERFWGDVDSGGRMPAIP
jgi:hypothetical protein